MNRKAKTDDWLTLASAAVDSRDALRAALPALQRACRDAGDPEVRRLVSGGLNAVVGAIDRLRHALKDRRASCRKQAA